MSFHALHGSEGYAARSDEVVAHSRKRLRGSAHSVGNVPDAWIFSFQGSLSRKALRKQICLASCGENPLTIRWVMLSDFWTFLFSLSPFNGHFSARCQVSHRIYFYCGSERNNGGASRISRVLGKALPNKIPMGQNERTANYGTSVESCSDNSRSAPAVKLRISPSAAYNGCKCFCRPCAANHRRRE